MGPIAVVVLFVVAMFWSPFEPHPLPADPSGSPGGEISWADSDWAVFEESVRSAVAAGADTRLRPTLRRAADQQLAQRLPGAAKGEKMAMARKAGPGLVQRLRDDPDPRVMGALLENPRLTEGQILPALNRPDTPPAVLDVVARDRRWGVRYPVRCALARNPSTPVDAALRILPHLKKPDLRAVTRQTRVAAVVRKRAKLLLGGS